MKDTLRIGGITLGIFLAGLLAGVWTQNLHPLPPPPMPPMGELGPPAGPSGMAPMQFPLTRENAAELEARMEKLRPQIEAFERELQGLETRFRERFEAILTPEQKATVTKLRPPSFLPPPSRAPDRMLGPLGGIAFFTIITPAFEHFSRELNLSAGQQNELKALLLQRREEFLHLVDTTPPPSLQLGRPHKE